MVLNRCLARDPKLEVRDGIPELQLGVQQTAGKEVINKSEDRNRRIRNRMCGGVGGRREQSRLLPDRNLVILLQCL